MMAITDRRSSARHSRKLETKCRVPASPMRVMVRDLSRSGCRLHFLEGHIPESSTVDLALGPDISVRGRVVWSTGYSVGVQFDRALDFGLAVQLELEQAPSEAVVTVRPEEYAAAGRTPHHLRQKLANALQPKG